MGGSIDGSNVAYDDILNYPYWRHRIPLGDGNYTPGKKSPAHWDVLRLPDRVDGKRVLTIGAWDGLHAFEAERRGASEVLATDIWDMDKEERGLPKEQNLYLDVRDGKRGFDLVKAYRNSDVQSKRIDVYDVAPDTVGTFDLVVCSGVIYHLRHPLRAIDNLSSVADDMLVVESDITHAVTDPPALAVTPRGDHKEDGYFQWRPNMGCLEDMAWATNPERVKSYMNVSNYKRNASDVIGESPETKLVYFRTVTSEASVYRECDQQTKVAELKPGDRVLVTYDEIAGVRRVQQGLMQGWIDSDEVGQRDIPMSDASLLERAAYKINNEGVRGLGQSARSLLERWRNPDRLMDRGVIHAWYSSGGD